MIEENLFDAVIGLPANLFTTTGIPVAILLFDRSREQDGENEERKDVLFIDASKEFTPGKTQNVMDDAHIAKVLDTYASRAEVEKYSHQASLEEIDVAALQKEIVQIEAELAGVRERMAGYLKELGVDA